MDNSVFKKILIPLDGSANSMKVVDYAADLSQKYNSELIILHVLFSQTGFAFHKETAIGTITSSSLNGLTTESKHDAQKWFNEIIRTKEKMNIQIKTEVVFTVISIVEAILTYAEKENVDMIVIGSKGRTGFKKLLLGSVAAGISTFAHCPVLIIK